MIKRETERRGIAGAGDQDAEARRIRNLLTVHKLLESQKAGRGMMMMILTAMMGIRGIRTALKARQRMMSLLFQKTKTAIDK